MALESLPKIAPALFSAEQDLIQIYNKKSDTVGTINASYIGGSTPPSGVSGAIQFSDGSAFASDAANLFWDDVNKRLGIGTNAPTTKLQVNGTSSVNGQFDVTNGTANFRVTNSSTSYVSLNYGSTQWATYNASETYFQSSEFFAQSGSNFRFSGNGIFGTTSSLGARLGVRGSGSTSATTSLLVQNSAGVTALEVLDGLSVRSDNSQLFFTNTSAQHRLGLMTFTNNSISCLSTLNIGGNTATNFSNTNLNFQTSTTFNAMASPNNATRTGISIIGDFTNSGAGINSVGNNFNITTALNTSVGNVTLNQFNITNTINTTGGTTLQRGFYYNPTLTGTVGFTHYAIQTTSGGAYINTTTPQASACLQADSTTQGFLPPRMTNAERAAITTPAIGLMVYCTDATEGLYVYKSTGWTFVI